MSKKKKIEAWAENGLEDWGSYMAAKKAKLEEQFDEAAVSEVVSATKLFKGISIFVNGYTHPCANDLKRLMMEHGGIYHHYLRPHGTTHLIASNLPYSKIIQYRKSKNPLPLCKPEWITDSISANKLLDWRPYLLYSTTSVTQPQLHFKNDNQNHGPVDTSSVNGDSSLKTLDKVLDDFDDPSDSVLKKQEPGAGVPGPSHEKSSVINSNDKFIDAGTCSSVDKESLDSIPGPSNFKQNIPTTSSAININDNEITHVSDSINSNNKLARSGAALCSKNDEFITEFYNNSRLHHISTMGATFKEYVNELRAKNTGSYPGLERLKKLKPIDESVKDNSNESDSDESIFNSDRISAAKPQDKAQSDEFVDESDSDEDLFDLKERAPKKNFKKPEDEKDKVVIMHIDMDCFFVSVGLRNKPELKGQPVAVTHARGNRPTSVNNNKNNNNKDEEFLSMAEIASCSYEARKLGIKNGMFLGQALKLCPNLKTIKYDFEGYKEVSYILYNTVASYTLDIEAVSCDEMYADVTRIISECKLTALEFADIIRREIKDKTGCPVSTGFGGNKLQARLATKKAKPDGQFYLISSQVKDYIGGIGVRELPGVGYSTMHSLKKMNIKICSDLQEIPLIVLQKEFGRKTGELLYSMCRGIDTTKLNIEHVRKSVSAEVNYGIRFDDDNDAREFLKKLAREVSGRLTKVNAKGRCITLKLMVRAKNAPKETAKFMGHGVCDNYTKSKNFITAIDDEVVVTREVLSLWEAMGQPADDIRGIGIQISRLEMQKKNTDTYMMKFVARAKQPNNNIIDKVSDKNDDADVLKESDNQNQAVGNKGHNLLFKNGNDNKNDKIKVKDKDRDKITKVKPQGLKAFFTSTKSTIKNSKPSNFFPSSTEIDSAVLNELPDDIKMEILNYHKNQAGPSKAVANNEQDNLTLKKSGGNLKIDDKSGDEGASGSAGGFDKKLIQESQGIDESVLTELPEDIRNEILATKPIVKKKPSQVIDNNYFKQTKPGKFSKTKLPEVQELDMQVLIELPDDIRNEIMNHYKSNADGDDGADGRNGNPVDEKNPDVNQRRLIDETSVTFSQVDPDFLAALSDDMKQDVKIYCMTKKKEKERLKNTEPINLPIRAGNEVKSKRGRKPKKFVINNNNNTQSNGRVLAKAKEVKINERINNDNDRNLMITKRRSFLENEINISSNDNKLGVDDRREAIKSHQSFFRGRGRVKSDEHQEMLNNLVNYLFSLPLHQVKNHLQAWILNSPYANEIDILSIATFLSMLPNEKRIEDLHILMKTMYRCMTKSGSCVWHETYRKTVEHVQHYMQIEYNSNLMLPLIRCSRRECKT
ncbi:DNA repair protein REV1 [Microplitis mediator]|uniref:DNA repair protein REV1 n=1 Tax=Microplitis mediator TaxID=375433 RepID=UPI002557B2BC|nr:DNA repair protein REV1 [Microplitis mediator]